MYVKLFRDQFFLITIIIALSLLLNVQVVSPENTNETMKYPLRISTNELWLQLGESSTVFLTPNWRSFNQSFPNETTFLIQFKPDHLGVIETIDNITINTKTFSNQSILVTSISPGRVIVTADASNISMTDVPANTSISVSNVFLRVFVYKLEILNVLSQVVGWIYFVCWSISFYPQIIQNLRRKSVRGLSADFVYLNLVGHTLYGIYNIGLFSVKEVQAEYSLQYPTSILPVQINDVVFSLHAIFAASITAMQTFVYDKGPQTISKVGTSFLFLLFTVTFVSFIVTASGGVSWLTFLTVCALQKLFVTLIKYVPQAVLNYKRKSTSGWCIGNVLLDFSGGIFSIAQMFILAYNNDDWSSIFGDVTKFGLGFFSVAFDVFFIIQHYVLYRGRYDEYEPLEGTTREYDDEGLVATTSSNQLNADFTSSSASH